MYGFQSRVRYSEVDESGFLTLPAMMDYLQDCSTFQSEALGVGIDWLRERNRAWFLNAWHIVIDRKPRLGDPISVWTAAHGFQGLYGLRHFCIRDGAENMLLRADSMWFMYDLSRMFPAKPTEEFSAPYLSDTDIPGLELPPMERKITVPEEMHALESLTVMKHHLDTNHHVNNAQYVRIAMEAAGAEAVSELFAEYRKAAVLGDRMYVSCGTDGRGMKVVSLSDAEGKPYALVRFREEGKGRQQ